VGVVATRPLGLSEGVDGPEKVGSVKRLRRSWIGAVLETEDFGRPLETVDAAGVPGFCGGIALSEEPGCRTIPVADRVLVGSARDW
jgi:hypothetical protein